MLIAELLAQRRKQPLAPVPGMTGRQPPAMISGIDRPHVPDLMPLDVDHRDQRATARGGRAPGAGRHDHDPGGTAGFHHPYWQHLLPGANRAAAPSPPATAGNPHRCHPAAYGMRHLTHSRQGDCGIPDPGRFAASRYRSPWSEYQACDAPIRLVRCGAADKARRSWSLPNGDSASSRRALPRWPGPPPGYSRHVSLPSWVNGQADRMLKQPGVGTPPAGR